MSGKRMGEGKGRERKKYIGVRDKWVKGRGGKGGSMYMGDEKKEGGLHVLVGKRGWGGVFKYLIFIIENHVCIYIII
jgi:hypothetical protein